MASSARRACTRNSTRKAAAAPSEATTGVSPQPYWCPPQERPSSSAVAMPTISPAPNQSMIALPVPRNHGIPNVTSASATIATGMLM